MPSLNAVTLSDLTFRWPNSPQATLIIEQLNIEPQEHVFIKGPSGCGKSTLLSILTGIQNPTQGSVRILNTDLASLNARARDQFRADHIGYIFQQFNLLPYLNVLDNVLLPLQFSKKRRQATGRDTKQKARLLLSQLGLPENLFSQSVTALSIGQQQRVAAARALIGDPDLIIADEPTSALDHDNRHTFIELLLSQANRVGSTVLFVSHDPTLEAQFSTSLDLTQINLAYGA
ncbi:MULTISPECIES: ABC transporter ATP-binding protein [unclassified Vibrio]|uniref:ABC transporter ATP-binding protein n=1 Tax=Vibrio sp. HB236076 TaxID=3232307 RepID=A0AB39HBL9_9VIBR|nr:ABC transporter ATP-binding protein [Vibrio sp. HB161653]MDP5255594.1 ABC transporter ATP-binding protein [Vibrio sp. HB161653]